MKIEEVCEKIKNLEIQGARNVAISALDSLVYEIGKSKSKNKEQIISEILVNMDKLASLRSTEPMLENLLSSFFNEIKDKKNVNEIKKYSKIYLNNFKKNLDKNLEKIVIYGTNLLKDKERILTHCHSSTVERILINLGNLKEIKVFCTETRPKFQGRITARNLSKNGINVTMIVDSAVNYIMKDIDVVIVGADVVTCRGALINKIGTSAIAILAKEYNVPFYSACELWKYDKKTRFGIKREIELRDPSEIISKEEIKMFGLEKINILNPSFDVTDEKYINGYICEEGVVTPYEFVKLAEENIKRI